MTKIPNSTIIIFTTIIIIVTVTTIFTTIITITIFITITTLTIVPLVFWVAIFHNPNFFIIVIVKLIKIIIDNQTHLIFNFSFTK